MNIGNKLLPIAPLFVPGNRADMLSKVTNFNARWIVPDLEDSVPVTEKETAQSNFSLHPTVVKIANSSKDTISIINEFVLANKINYVPKKDLKFFLKSFINQEDENYSILDNFVKIYSNI